MSRNYKYRKYEEVPSEIMLRIKTLVVRNIIALTRNLEVSNAMADRILREVADEIVVGNYEDEF